MSEEQFQDMTARKVSDDFNSKCVDALREWILANYKPTRLEAMDAEIPGYSETVIRSHEQRVATTGSTVISRHESKSGKAEYYPHAYTMPGRFA